MSHGSEDGEDAKLDHIMKSFLLAWEEHLSLWVRLWLKRVISARNFEVGGRSLKVISDAQWSDDAVFTCVTEDDEKCSAKLDVIMQEKKVKKVEKPKEVIKKVEFDDKKSYEMVESLFELKVKIFQYFWKSNESVH